MMILHKCLIMVGVFLGLQAGHWRAILKINFFYREMGTNYMGKYDTCYLWSSDVLVA